MDPTLDPIPRTPLAALQCNRNATSPARPPTRTYRVQHRRQREHVPPATLGAVVELVDRHPRHQQQQRLPLEHRERPLQHKLHQHRNHQDLRRQERVPL